MFNAKQRRLSAPTALERRLAPAVGRRKPVTWEKAWRALKRALVREALGRNAHAGHWNIAAAARELGIGRNTLYDVLRKM